MKNFRAILTFTCLGFSWVWTPVAQAQHKSVGARFPQGTYAIIHHPLSGAVQLVDLSAPHPHTRWDHDNDVPHRSVSGRASVSGYAALAYDGRREQLVYTGRSSTRTAVWSHDLSEKDAEHIGDIPLTPGHVFTKMAAAPDGHVYALTTPVTGSSGTWNQRCMMVRITPGPPGKPSTARVIGELSVENGFCASMIYSGDMAFSANGDLYIFATALDTLIQYYTGSEVFRINAAHLRTKSTAAIPVERLGPIKGMGTMPGYDSTVISGAAFLPDGRFLLSATDKSTEQAALLFVGRFLPESISVEPVLQGSTSLPEGYLIGDLASRFFPALPPVRRTRQTPAAVVKSDTQQDNWQQYVTIRTYLY